MQQLDQVQKFGQDNMDAAMKAFGTMAKGVQAITAEAADFARKNFEHSAATLEKLLGARTLDKAVEVHSDYLKGAYEGFVAQSTKMGELYTGLAKDAFKPYESLVARNTPAAQ